MDQNQNGRRKVSFRPVLHRQKSTNKPLTKYQSDMLRTDFANIEVELENNNLKKMIKLLEGKTKVLEEHCSLLREKNLYFETRLRDMQRGIDNMRDSGLSDKNAEEESEDEHSQKDTSFKDRVSGAIFGVLLPKFWEIITKIKDKRKEMKAIVEEHGDGEGGLHFGRHFHMKEMDCKQRIQTIKVNLFRVVVVIGSLMIISGIGYAAYRVWKTRYRHPTYLIPSEEEEDDSGEEIFRAPGASRSTERILKTNSTDSFETPGISTDFKSILDTANKK